MFKIIKKKLMRRY
jgi:hypothetical protein